MDAVNWPTQARKELIDQYLMCRALTQTFNCSDKRFGNGGSGKWGEWGGGRGRREEGGKHHLGRGNTLNDYLQ